MKVFTREAKNAVLILLGIFAAGMGLKGFLLSSRFIDGGVTGVSMLLSNVLGWRLATLILVINLPFIALHKRFEKACLNLARVRKLLRPKVTNKLSIGECTGE